MINEFLNSLIPSIQHFGILSYWIVLLVFFAESMVFVGLLIPGAMVAILLGALSAKGVFQLGDLIFFAAIGFYLGDLVSFYLGQKGTSLFKEENKILKLAHIEKAEAFFNRHGSKSVLLGRFIGPLRPLIPFVAGLTKMKLRRFMLLNLLGVSSWVLIHILIGYFFGHAISLIKLWTTRAEMFLIIVSIFFLLFYFLRWLIFRKGKSFWLILGSILKSLWQGFLSNREIRKLTRKYPKFFNWLDQRTDTSKFTGLPLSALCLALLYVLSLFFKVLFGVVYSKTIIEIDARVESIFYAFRNPVFIKAFLTLTLFGKMQIVAAFFAGASALFWINRKRIYILPLAISTFGAAVTNYFIKISMHRPRPTQSFYQENFYSFPSFHAAIAFAFYGYIFYYFWRNTNTWNKKINALFGGFLVVLVIGFSRIYLNVEYVSDIWAGYLVGIFWLIVSIVITEWLIWKNKASLGLKEKKLKQKTAIFAVVLLELIIFVSAIFHYRTKINLTSIDNPPTIFTENILRSFEEHRLSKYSEKLDGSQEQPLNFIISADNDQDLIDEFSRIGWYKADPISFDSINRIARAALFNKSYLTAPMTPSFWQAEVNDFGFEKPTPTNSVKQRHHARFWRINFKTPNGKNIYVGTISLDIGIKWYVTHRISPDIDTEKDALLNDFLIKRRVASHSTHKFVKPVLGKNLFGDQFFTNGEIYIIDLK